MICTGGMCLHHFNPPPSDCGRGRFWQGSCRREFVQAYLPTETLSSSIRSHLISIWNGLDLALRRQVLKRTDAVLSISQGLLDMYLAAEVRLPDRRFIAYNLPPVAHPSDGQAIPNDLLSLLKGKLLVLYTGKLSPGKGTPHLIDAAQSVLTKRQDVVFFLVGKGQNAGTLAPGIIATGPMPHATVLQLYQLADIVVLPSIVPEGSGRTLLEAMTYGKPVIGTRIGGIPELVEDGLNGYLVERGDVEGLKNALLTLLADKHRRVRMGQASLQLVQTRYNPETNIRNLISFYQETLALCK
jgi:glycosyltransferase involved in cell wall biosynthesis